MAQKTWTHDQSGNALSGDWTSGWTNGTPTAGDFAGLTADLVHPFTVKQSTGIGAIGTLAIGGAGTLAVTGGTLTIGTGFIGDILSPSLVVSDGTVAFGTAKVAGLSQSGGVAQFGGASEVNGAFNLSGGTVSVSGTLLVDDDPNVVFTGDTYTLASTIGGTGTFRLGSFDDFTLGTGLVLSVATLAFDHQYESTGTIGLAADVFYGGVIVAPVSTTGTGVVTIDLAGHTLSLEQIGALTGTITDSGATGTLLAAGVLTGTVNAASLVEIGTSLSITTGAITGGQLRIDTGSTVTVAATGAFHGPAVVLGSLDLANGDSGPYSVVGNGTVQIDAGTLSLQGIGTTGFDGAFVGAGTLQLGGEQGGTLTAGAVLSVASTILTGTVTVAGSVEDTGGLSVDGGLLIVDGSLSVGKPLVVRNFGLITGTGNVVAKGGFTADRLLMEGAVTLENAGVGDVSSISTGSSGLLGDGTGEVALVNDAGATLSLDNVELLDQNEDSFATTLVNHGQLIASGTISADVTNDGTVNVTDGDSTLDLFGAYADSNPTGGLLGVGTVLFGGDAVLNIGLAGSYTVGPNVIVGATLALAGTASTTVLKSVDFNQSLTMQADAVLDVGQQVADLFGTASLQGTITGTAHPFANASTVDGFVEAKNFSVAAPLTLAGAVGFQAYGLNALQGTITIGGSAGVTGGPNLPPGAIANGPSADSTAFFEVEPTAVLSLAAGLLITGTGLGGLDTTGSFADPFTNLGFVGFAAAGQSATIDVAVGNLDGGVVEVSAGTLVLADGVASSGAPGTLRIDGGGTLELRGPVFGGQVINVASAGAYLKLDTPSHMFAPIDMAEGGTIEVAGVAPDNWHYSNGLLTISDSAGVTLDVAALDTGLAFDVVEDSSLGSLVTLVPACFAAGTTILTGNGPVAVEALHVGDAVVLADGGTAPVVWLGHRRVECRRHPRPRDVQPIRVRAHAFGPGPGRPDSDLRLSPDHAVYCDGVLIPIRLLVNGRSVVREDVADVTYWHVELPRHGVLLARGLPCESFLDTGNRAAFANGGAPIHLHPDFAARIWDAEACAPLVLGGARLERVRAMLRDVGCHMLMVSPPSTTSMWPVT
jgi:hypothetical protein